MDPITCKSWKEIEPLWLGSMALNTQQSFMMAMRQWLGFLMTLGQCEETTLSLLLKATPLMGIKFVEYLRSEGLSWASIRTRRGAVSSLYGFLELSGLFTGQNPARGMKLPRGKAGPKRPTQALSEQQAIQLLSCAKLGYKEKALVTLMLASGMRSSEIRNLTPADIEADETRARIKLSNTKTAVTAYQYLPYWAFTIIRDYIDRSCQHSGERVFGYTSQGLNYVFKRILKKAGIVGPYTPHSTRATAINKLLNDGFTAREVQNFSRHSSVTTVDLYDRGAIKNPGLSLVYGGLSSRAKAS